jgi:hypothetical protein
VGGGDSRGSRRSSPRRVSIKAAMELAFCRAERVIARVDDAGRALDLHRHYQTRRLSPRHARPPPVVVERRQRDSMALAIFPPRQPAALTLRHQSRGLFRAPLLLPRLVMLLSQQLRRPASTGVRRTDTVDHADRRQSGDLQPERRSDLVHPVVRRFSCCPKWTHRLTGRWVHLLFALRCRPAWY